MRGRTHKSEKCYSASTRIDRQTIIPRTCDSKSKRRTTRLGNSKNAPRWQFSEGKKDPKDVICCHLAVGVIGVVRGEIFLEERYRICLSRWILSCQTADLLPRLEDSMPQDRETPFEQKVFEVPSLHTKNIHPKCKHFISPFLLKSGVSIKLPQCLTWIRRVCRGTAVVPPSVSDAMSDMGSS